MSIFVSMIESGLIYDSGIHPMSDQGAHAEERMWKVDNDQPFDDKDFQLTPQCHCGTQRGEGR